MAGYHITRSSADHPQATGGEDKTFDLIYKMLVIGDSSVGKTTLLTRFVEEKYHSNFMSTVGKCALIGYKGSVKGRECCRE